MKRFFRIGCLCFCLLYQQAILADNFGQAATINGVSIPRSRVQAQVDSAIATQGVGSGGITQPKRYATIQSRITENLITQEVLWQQAQKTQHIAAQEQVDKAYEEELKTHESERYFSYKLEERGFSKENYREDIRQRMSISLMLKAEVEDKLVIPQSEIEKFYQDNLDNMSYPEAFRARHILIRIREGATDEEVDNAREYIENLRGLILAGDDFAETARGESEDNSAERGGDLGYFARGQMVPEFQQAVESLEPGEISEVVRTVFGLHLIKLEEKREGKVAPLEEVEEQIREHLSKQKLNEEITRYIETLRDEADVEIHIY